MRWLVVAAVAGCSGGSNAPTPKPVIPMDAPAARPLGPVSTDPATTAVRVDRPAPPTNRPSHPIDVILRSTPNSAQVAVDGMPLGPTPAYWNGTADGREHEFTFVLPGHAVARYRFVPITSGVVHARLEPIPSEEIDAGVPTGVVAPVVDPPLPGIPTITPPAPDAAPVPPPPTVITPDASSDLDGFPSGAGPQP